MQRIKTFLVVCLSMVIMGTTLAQTILPNPLTGTSGLRTQLLSSLVPAVSGSRIPVWNAGLSFYQPFTVSGLVLSSSDRILSSLQPGLFSVGSVNAFGPNAAAMGVLSLTSSPTLENDYYTRHFGFFCKRELEFEKTTRIPLRFRLGSLEQCNALEGKH
jgi:hypothetical protein